MCGIYVQSDAADLKPAASNVDQLQYGRQKMWTCDRQNSVGSANELNAVIARDKLFIESQLPCLSVKQKSWV
jgi:hypothetical protein